MGGGEQHCHPSYLCFTIYLIEVNPPVLAGPNPRLGRHHHDSKARESPIEEGFERRLAELVYLHRQLPFEESFGIFTQIL